MTSDSSTPGEHAQGQRKGAATVLGAVLPSSQYSAASGITQRPVKQSLVATLDGISRGRADWIIRFVSYGLIGGTAAIVNLICFTLLYYQAPISFGNGPLAHAMRYVVVFAIAAEISTFTNFVINDRVTFSRLPGHARSWIVRCLRFHLTTLVGTMVTLVISFLLTRAGFHAFLAEATAIGVAFLLNFTLHHVFTYRRLYEHEGENPDSQGVLSQGSVASGASEGYILLPSYSGVGRRVSLQPLADDHTPTPRREESLKFSLVIPAHNEEEALRPTISRLYIALYNERIPFEILVVNDHSTDTTQDVLEQLSLEYPGVRYVRNEKPGGFGRAIQTGLENFAGDAVCIVMADASDDPRDVVTYYHKLQEGYECVFGSRFVAGSKVVDYPRHKLIVNRIANWFINVLFQLHFNDTTNAFKAYRREVIAGIMPVLGQHFNITVELPLKAITRGYTYTTIPINWYNRATGVSKLKIQEMGSRYLFIVLYVWLEKMLSRGDYRRPTLAADHEGERALIWERYETMPHRIATHSGDKLSISIPAEASISEQETMYGGERQPHTDMMLRSKGPSMFEYAPVEAKSSPSVPSGSMASTSIQVSMENVSDNNALQDSPHIPGAFLWLTSLAIVLLGLGVYAQSTAIRPLSDDWEFLSAAHAGPSAIFGFQSNYHYNPVAKALIYLVYLIFGLNPTPYHVVVLGLFSVSVVLVLHIGRKLTGSFTVGVLASLLFVLSGRQYEGIIWTVVSFFQALGLVFYLSGLLFYLHAQDHHGQRRRHIWMLVGFYLCMILAVFTYEQEITLVVACALYRLFVVEHKRGLGMRNLLSRARTWAVEFGFPIVFFAAYLAFKYWLSLKTGRSQAPGLNQHLSITITTITVGLYQSFMPGIIAKAPLNLQVLLIKSLATDPSVLHRLVSFAAVLLPLVTVIVFAKSVYRWLAIWSVLVVASTVLGIGYLASRYQMLFVVPAVILWAGLLVWLAKKLRDLLFSLMDDGVRTNHTLQRLIPTISWLPLIALLAFYGSLGVQYTLVQEANWQQASDIEGAAIQRIANLASEHPTAHILYLVNLPDALSAPAGWYEHGAYLFQDHAADMVELSMPGAFQGIDYLHTPDYHSIGTPRVFPRTQVDRLSEQSANLVVCFSSTTHQIEPWGPLCA